MRITRSSDLTPAMLTDILIACGVLRTGVVTAVACDMDSSQKGFISLSRRLLWVVRAMLSVMAKRCTQLSLAWQSIVGYGCQALIETQNMGVETSV